MLTEAPPVAAISDIADHVLPGSGTPEIERTPSGVSTPVYRISRSGVTLYLRLAESPTADLAPEAIAHRLLRERGAKVPEVVFYDPFDERIGRSLMVTTEIPGKSLAEDTPTDLDEIVRNAGHDLAIINSITVDGFGWIRRDDSARTRLKGEASTLREFVLDRLGEELELLEGPFLSSDETRAIANLGTEWRLDPDPGNQARLAHGDFDVSHIFHRGETYTSIIDFGEIRGADPFYDLGHFALHDGQPIAQQLLPSLLEGYRAEAQLPDDVNLRIHRWAVFIGVAAIARGVTRPRSPYQDYLARAIRNSLSRIRG